MARALFTVWFCLLCCIANVSAVESVTLAWDRSPDPTVIGYKIYVGQASGSYDGWVDAYNNTTNTVYNLQDDTKYFFAATAYNILGLESGFSQEISYTVPYSPKPLRNRFTISWPGADRLWLEFSTNLINWSRLATNVSSPFIFSNAPAGQMFLRANGTKITGRVTLKLQ